MSNTIATTPADQAQVARLLDKDVPSYRQAYSDRTAWLMACLAELAYIRFNPVFESERQRQLVLDQVARFEGDQKRDSLTALIDLVAYDHDAEREVLAKEIGRLRFEGLDTFHRDGTQAFLTAGDKFAVLSFRGTEATSIKDIKADMDAVTMGCESGGRVHSGFSKAFDLVFLDIVERLKAPPYHDKPLFITGHSLGGALATVAAKRLGHAAGLAACYTFGAPRVGDEDWIADIKTPVYRVVNAADCVTMLPPGTEIVTVLGWIVHFIPGVGGTLRKWLLSRFGGYLHAGHMFYLTNVRTGQFEDTKLLFHVSLFYRLKGLIYKKLPWKAFLSDHSIRVYRKKLAVIAERRNQD